MKKILIVLLVIIVGFAGWLFSTFTASNLSVGTAPSFTIPENRTPAEMTITALSAGKMYSKAGLAFRGGKFSDERIFTMGGVLIEHPQGRLLVDTGFGSDVGAHFLTTPKMMQWTSKIETGVPVADQLADMGIAPDDLTAVILTHTHWDHVSGLDDLKGATVWVTQAELEFANADTELTKLASLIGTQTYSTIEFDDEPYLGFEQSFDVFGDGAVVIVPAAGHTPGALVVFVTLADDSRYAFIGDLAWQREGIEWPAEKPWLPRTLVEEDTEAQRTLLVRMHHLNNTVPNLTVVPSHDQEIWNQLPKR
jgi:glyoxylase-like metal-dependent hydrolase (beta-lactamase superfamily II)